MLDIWIANRMRLYAEQPDLPKEGDETDWLDILCGFCTCLRMMVGYHNFEAGVPRWADSALARFELAFGIGLRLRED